MATFLLFEEDHDRQEGFVIGGGECTFGPSLDGDEPDRLALLFQLVDDPDRCGFLSLTVEEAARLCEHLAKELHLARVIAKVRAKRGREDADDAS